MMIIPADLPARIAPLAWLLGRWQGWGMAAPRLSSAMEGASHATNPATPAEDFPVIEEVTADIVGLRLRVITSIYHALPTSGAAADIDPTWDADQALAALEKADLIWEETLYMDLLPGSGVLPAPGEYEPREISATSATTDGHALIWAGVSMGPRIQMVADAIARTDEAAATTHCARMYGLVAGELMWTTESTREGDEEAAVDFSGRLARIDGEDLNV
ncbi:MAG: heme-binding beta-barrel domain-containing protein [Actinomycetaceae bacterium]|nr:heme-binding beta-barrel domain-containing protein [Actinomycetaceae bacterium]